MPNDMTGRKVNGNSPLPSAAVVAMTLLGGQRACMICGEPTQEARVACEPCCKSIEPFNYSTPDGQDFIAYRDAPFRPKWFRDTRFGYPLSQEQLESDQRDEHTKHCKSGGNTACEICQILMLRHAIAGSGSLLGCQRKALEDQQVACHQVVNPGKRTARCSGLGERSWWRLPEIETPSVAYAEGPHHKATRIRQLYRLYTTNLSPLKPDQDLTDHPATSFLYGAPVRRFGL